MNKILLFSFLIFLLSCSEEIKPKNKFVGYWENEGKFRKWMQINILIEKDNQFTYWFNSDRKTPDDPQMPLKGTYKIEGDIITLQTKNEDHIYSGGIFVLKQHEGRSILLAKNQLESWENKVKANCHPLYKSEIFEIKKNK